MLVNKTFDEVLDLERNSEKWVFSDGAVNNIPINQPGFSEGLLVERSQWNAIPFIEDFENAYWIKQNASLDASTIDNPAGDGFATVVSNDGGNAKVFAANVSGYEEGQRKAILARSVSGTGTATLLKEGNVVELSEEWQMFIVGVENEEESEDFLACELNGSLSEIVIWGAQFVGEQLVLDQLRSLIQDLYGNDEQGAFYVPKPVVLGEQVLFQDAAGTVPVVDDGDPVGLMLDLSGNDNHASQNVSGARPIYRKINGKHSIQGDGVSAKLDIDPTIFRERSQMLCAIGHGGYSGSSTRYSFGVGRASGLGAIYFGFRFAANSREIRARRISADSQTNFILPVGLDRYSNVSFSDYINGKLRAYQNGEFLGEEGYASAGLSANDTDSAEIMNLYRDPFYFNGHVYGLVVQFDSVESEALATDIDAYMQSLTGIGGIE